MLGDRALRLLEGRKEDLDERGQLRARGMIAGIAISVRVVVSRPASDVESELGELLSIVRVPSGRDELGFGAAAQGDGDVGSGDFGIGAFGGGVGSVDGDADGRLRGGRAVLGASRALVGAGEFRDGGVGSAVRVLELRDRVVGEDVGLRLEEVPYTRGTRTHVHSRFTVHKRLKGDT